MNDTRLIVRSQADLANALWEIEDEHGHPVDYLLFYDGGVILYDRRVSADKPDGVINRNHVSMEGLVRWIWEGLCPTFKEGEMEVILPAPIDSKTMVCQVRRT